MPASHRELAIRAGGKRVRMSLLPTSHFLCWVDGHDWVWVYEARAAATEYSGTDRCLRDGTAPSETGETPGRTAVIGPAFCRGAVQCETRQCALN